MGLRFERCQTDTYTDIITEPEEPEELFDDHHGQPTLIIGDISESALAIHGSIEQLKAFATRIPKMIEYTSRSPNASP